MNPFVSFQEVRCPNCNKLLFKVRGLAEIEIICPRCKPPLNLIHWPDFGSAAVFPATVVRPSIAIPATQGASTA